jgi:hypothetical protein
MTTPERPPVGAADSRLPQGFVMKCSSPLALSFPRLGVPSLAAVISMMLAAGMAGAVDIDPQKLPPAAARPVDFRQDVYPLLSERCFKCHQGQNPRSGQRLDQRAELLGETNGKPMVQVAQSAKSRLIHLVSGQLDGETMPPGNKPLTAEQVGLLRAWIDQGLKWDDALLPPSSTTASHWAFRPVKRPEVPRVKNAPWVRTPIDAFIAAQQEAAGVSPAAEASPRTLLRRLALDLIGLPPTPDDVDAFVRAGRDRANRDAVVAEWVERLLNSPHHGERWARHWLDLARYADSEGYESDHLRPYAWRYRDWVVQSFNRDRPYNQFLREQLAGDELQPYTDENLIATGFLASARLSSNEEDKARQRNDVLTDIVNATASSLLGLTLNCAQCHNHKFDPFTARDYYRFMGFFVKGQPANLVLQDRDLWAAYEAARPAEYEPARKLQQALLEGARQRLIADARRSLTPEMQQALDTPAEKRTPEQERLAREADLKFQFTPNRIEKAISDDDRKLYDELKKKIEALEKKMPDRPQTFGFYSPASPTKVETLPMKGFYPLPYVPEELIRAKPHLLVAGDVQRPGPEVDVGWPAVFGPTPAGTIEKSPRRALADWITSPANPLTARVWVNRLWHYHFGRGLVQTVSDFGTKGSPPTHPALLDWLAAELVESGWSTKHIHRLIVNSNTYRQSASVGAEQRKLDPDNKLWTRWQPRRLESEALRDALLAVAGELERKLGGAPEAQEKSIRRSLYVQQRRNTRPMFQAMFDGPQGTESCACRHVTTVPLQPLYLLNNEYVLARAKAFAQRVQAKAGSDPRRQVEVCFELTLGRPPDEKEQELARGYLKAHAEPALALVHFCHAVMNLNEFAYIE